MGCAHSAQLDASLPVGRLEPAPQAPSANDKLYSRDGLHSAPLQRAAPPAQPHTETPCVPVEKADLNEANAPSHAASPFKSRAGLHSAPITNRVQPTSSPRPSEPFEPVAGLDEFIIDKQPGQSGDEIDGYLTNVFTQATVRNLQSAQWAERVQGIEDVKSQLNASRRSSTSEQLAVFKACVTLLTRLLQDRVVPVFLPSLELLIALFNDEHLSKLPTHLPRAAVAITCNHMVLRSGSSNSRARDEAIAAILHCARCATLGPLAVAPAVLKPLPNSRSQHAAVGRLELLHTLIIKFGFTKESGFTHERVLTFVVPLCDSASEKTREAALSLVKEARLANANATNTILLQLNPPLAATLDPGMKPPAVPNQRRTLPPIGSRVSSAFAASNADVVVVAKTRKEPDKSNIAGTVHRSPTKISRVVPMDIETLETVPLVTSKLQLNEVSDVENIDPSTNQLVQLSDTQNNNINTRAQQPAPA